MKTSLLVSLGATALGGLASAQDLSRALDCPLPVYMGRYDVVTQTHFPPNGQTYGAGTGGPIYVNTSFGSLNQFRAIGNGDTLYDEGRIPSTTSTPVVGTQDSYVLSSIVLGYATNEATVDFDVQLFESYIPCSPASANPVPIATLDINGLPGSTTGSIVAGFVEVMLPPGICMRADGDGVFDGALDGFGWAISTPNTGTTGPLIRGHPAVVPEGDGTVFQNGPPNVIGTGLSTLDLFRRVDAAGSGGCFFFGGYDGDGDPNFGSFFLIINSDLAGDCIGCGIGDDRFEENDADLDAAPIGYGAYPGLIADMEDDWFATTIPAGGDIVVDLLFEDAIGDLDLKLYDAATMTTLTTSTSVTDDERVSYINCDVTDLDVLIEVEFWSGACNEYDLILSSDPLCIDDALEDNDTCDTRLPLPLGTTTGLIVRPQCGSDGGEDSDYFGITLQPGESLTVDLLFVDAIADIDLRVYDVTSACPGTQLDSSLSTTDNESVVATNATAAPIDVAVRVDYFSGACNTYDMIACVTQSAGLGGTICAGQPNSTGERSTLCAEGSDVALDNDVTLSVSDLPLMSMGIFIVSQEVNILPNPGGSAGNICVASFNIGRYPVIQDSGATGTVSQVLDLSSTPYSGPLNPSGNPVAIVAGETWYWQYWHRDTDTSGNATSNFSSALCISFQ